MDNLQECVAEVLGRYGIPEKFTRRRLLKLIVVAALACGNLGQMSVPEYKSTKSALGHNITTLNVEYPLAGESQGGTAPSTVSSVYVALVGWFGASGTITITTPSGWTLAANVTSGDSGLSLYYKAYDASTGSVSFVASGTASKFEAAIDLYNGANLTTPAPITVTATNSGSGTSHSVGGITTAYNDSGLLAGFMSPDTPAAFNPPSGFSASYSGVSRTTTGGAGLLLSNSSQATAGASGAKTATSINADTQVSYSVNSLRILAALNPYLGPSAPTILTPNGGESITVGRTYSVTWLAATDPNTAQSALTYAVEYSSNDGASWTVLTAATSAGATTYPWNTTGLTPGTQYRIRIRASDGTNTGPYDTSDGAFTILADFTPGAPTPLSPTGGAVFDRAAAKVFTWAFNDPGDVQTAFQIQASTDGFATTPIDTGTVVSATSSHSFAGATFSHGPYQWRVRTKDNAGTWSAYSAAASFLAGDKPATPNFTAPTAGSPPTNATPTFTWTSTGQVARKLRIATGGGEIYSSGKTISASVTTPSPINLANGVSYTSYISIWNSDDLQSDEDSETFTPSFTAPAAPALSLADVPDGGYIQATIANSDTPAHNELWRYVTSEGSASAIQLADSLAVDGTFRDYTAASDIEYSYYAVAVDGSGLIAQSTTQVETLTLARLWLHEVTEGGTQNALNPLGLAQRLTPRFSDGIISAVKRAVGRTKPQMVFGQTRERTLSVEVQLKDSDRAMLDSLFDLFHSNSLLCVRDQLGHKLFGRIVMLPTQDNIAASVAGFAVMESDYDEGL